MAHEERTDRKRAAPLVSIIITNYNYGSFLRVAIDSALNQTDPMREVIVVDDGSTDGSAAILDGYGDRIVLVRQANAGQAAAFEAGFRRSTGGIILFLDADDALRPETVSTVRAVWYDGLAAVAYGLELIDRAGNRIGLYPANVTDADHRPQLVETGTFVFMPTSGNALARSVVASAVPFPAERWRISADAYLLRLAALGGRIVPIPHVLGSYRIHEANNYHALGAGQTWMWQRGQTQMADLAADLGSRKVLPGAEPGLAGALRVSLLLVAVASSLALLEYGRERKVGRDLLRAAAGILASDAPLWPRVSSAALWTVLAAGFWRRATIQRWLRHPQLRPAGLRWLLRVFGQRRLAIWLSRALAPRWKHGLVRNQTRELAPVPGRREVLGYGWSSSNPFEPPSTTDRFATLRFHLDPHPHPLVLVLDLAAGPYWEERELALEAWIDGTQVSTTRLYKAGKLYVLLPRGFAGDGRDVELEIRHRPGYPLSLRERWRGLREPSPTLRLERIWMGDRESLLDPPGVIAGIERPFADFVSAEADEYGPWVILPSGEAHLTSASGTFRLVSPARGARLLARFTALGEQPQGWLRIVAAGREIYSGAWGGPREVWCRIPGGAADVPQVHELTLSFVPLRIGEALFPSFSGASFLHDGHDIFLDHAPRETRLEVPPANPGQLLTFGSDALGANCLADGWTVDAGGIASLTGAEGALQILVPQSRTALDMRLAVEPVLPAPPGAAHLLIVTADDTVLAQQVLRGPAEVDVSLDAYLALRKGPVTLTVHSTFVALGAQLGDADDLEATFAPLQLRNIRFGEAPQAVQAAFPYEPNLASGFDQGIAIAARLLADEDPAGNKAALTAARHRIVTALTEMDARGLRSIFASENTVATLVGFAETLGTLDPAPAIAAAPAVGETERLRRLAVAMASGGANEMHEFSNLAGLPAPLYWEFRELGRYVARDPPLHSADPESYRSYIRDLLVSIDSGVSHDVATGHIHRLAHEVFRKLLPIHLLTGEGSMREHAEHSAAIIERVLTMRGHMLDRAFEPSRRRERLRVGILMRPWEPAPESWICKAMLEGLDPLRIEAVPVFVTTRSKFAPPAEDARPEGAPPAGAVYLTGATLGEAVDEVRRLDLDILLMGAFVFTWDRLTLLAAHRLAPVQMITAAIAPITSGFRSFDAVISSSLIEPPEAQSNYSEKLVLMDQPVQCFSVFGVEDETPVTRPSVFRRQVGLPYPAFLFVSGAMMYKIVPALLEAWLSILAQVPGSALVLYPFPRNWKINFAARQFRESVAAALRARGLAKDRVVILDARPAAEIRSILRAADLYLDSFPYAGATTVTEALDAGLPVVALRGAVQRARQGAGWLAAAGLEDDVAATVDGYVARAVALATDPDLHADRRARVGKHTSGRPIHRDVARFGPAFTDVLVGLAADRGITLALQSPPVPVEPRPEDIRYVFHHVPKTAGTAMAIVLRRWFKIHIDKRKPWATEGFPAPVDVAQLGPHDLLHGHFEIDRMRLRDRYPQVLRDPRFRVFSIVRDPLELALSTFFYEDQRRRDDPSFDEMSLSRFLRTRDSYLAHLLDVTASDWRERLDVYWFIGTMERFEESFTYIAAAMGHALPPIPVVNATPRTETPDPADIDVFMRNNAFDYDVYNYIAEKLDRRLREDPVETVGVSPTSAAG